MPHDPEAKHIVEGDLFVYRGVQFKVVSCLPSNGVVTADTEVFTTGPPLADIARLQIHPIFESQPNSEKGWTGAQLFQKYLLPYFQGRFRYVKQGERIEIDGVSSRKHTANLVANLRRGAAPADGATALPAVPSWNCCRRAHCS